MKYVFGSFGGNETLKIDYTFPDQGIAAVVERYWTNFAKTGNRNGPGVLSWPQDKNDRVLVFDLSGQHTAGGFRKPQLDFVGREIRASIERRENRNRWTAEGVDV